MNETLLILMHRACVLYQPSKWPSLPIALGQSIRPVSARKVTGSISAEDSHVFFVPCSRHDGIITFSICDLFSIVYGF